MHDESDIGAVPPATHPSLRGVESVVFYLEGGQTLPRGALRRSPLEVLRQKADYF